MRVYTDMSSINHSRVQKGYSVAVPYKIILDRYLSESKKEANLAKYADMDLRNEEWKHICEKERLRDAISNMGIMLKLEKHFEIGQFRKNYSQDNVFWFWCSNLYNTKGKQYFGRDYSYITLSLWDEYLESDYMSRAIAILTDYPCDRIKATIKYKEVFLDDVIKCEAEKLYNEYNGKFVLYQNYYQVKLRKLDDGRYTYRKKYQKKGAYLISPLEIIECIKPIPDGYDESLGKCRRL